MNLHRFAIAAIVAAAAGAHAALPDVDAEVRKVDPPKQTVLLKHGDIPNLGMTGMTMQFSVADAKLLKDVKAGDKVKVQIDMVGGKPTVVALRVVK